MKKKIVLITSNSLHLFAKNGSRPVAQNMWMWATGNGQRATGKREMENLSTNDTEQNQAPVQAYEHASAWGVIQELTQGHTPDTLLSFPFMFFNQRHRHQAGVGQPGPMEDTACDREDKLDGKVHLSIVKRPRSPTLDRSLDPENIEPVLPDTSIQRPSLLYDFPFHTAYRLRANRVASDGTRHRTSDESYKRAVQSSRSRDPEALRIQEQQVGSVSSPSPAIS
ncbi:hypothetical protein QBC35DRAFT_156119 [Podospora australis]|uniref:Uncharacterized protein n=1 Tax=Podospora australis TaxID=1536484 RepID=A0AAN7AKX2_9PEZI|nr:hypothetical protein QBC35DRAFT_156119 [Podospora australis]